MGQALLASRALPQFTYITTINQNQHLEKDFSIYSVINEFVLYSVDIYTHRYVVDYFGGNNRIYRMSGEHRLSRPKSPQSKRHGAACAHVACHVRAALSRWDIVRSALAPRHHHG